MFSVTNLPPGVLIFIDLQAYKTNIYGDPLTIPLRTGGVKDETLNFTAMLLKERGTSINMIWSPPTSVRYKGKELEYEVHYTNMIHRTNPGEMSNGESQGTSDLYFCYFIHKYSF